jgi:hypothetical protein
VLLGFTGALGSAVHGGYDLANALSTPTNTLTETIARLPNPVDPRGLLTFGVAGLGLFVLSWLMTFHGTHTGEFQGIAPTGKKVTIPALDMARFESGKLVEHWGGPNQMSLLQQLGVIPSMG